MSVPRCVILGGGGHARVIIDALRAGGAAEPAAILDSDKALHGSQVDGVRIVGSDEELPRLRAGGWAHFAMGMGGAGNNAPRRRVYDFALSAGLQPVTIVHPRAFVSPAATLGPGAQIMPGSLVCAGAALGANVLVNSGAIVEHDCNVGDHVHVASGACLCGAVTVGVGAHLGARCVVRQGITIGASALVAAGAVVVKDVPAGQKVAGVPARPWIAR